MKTSFLILTSLIVQLSTYAQGTVTFFNNNIVDPATGNTYRAGIYVETLPDPNDPTGPAIAPAGPDYLVGLFLPSNPNTPLKYIDGTPAVTTLRSTTAQEVFARTGDVIVDGAPPNTSATLLVRAWSKSAGSYENVVLTPGARRAEVTFTSKPLGGPNPDPQSPAFFTPDMAPFQGLVIPILPEPSTIALGFVGIAALLFHRRR